ncbi:DUF4145 domain-containing protein [Runella limosa]|uniref:DUF4145 domain-containing protein n=1 Tax=Runella limosa TaxID=370978 RepID=UPI000400FABC|nr:DUF4145 domain-containing protein [Runella limosa]
MKIQLQTNYGHVDFFDLPSKCPYCHKSIRPQVFYGYRLNDKKKLQVFMACPDNNCFSTFIGYYIHTSLDHYDFTGQVSQGTLIGRRFTETIETLSISFTKIYNQSFSAEQQGLFEICGVGYRKALEFLIKDYAIRLFPLEQERIEKKMLAQCIGDYVSDDKIKSVAKRAVWLGNDETHYVRKWEGKTLGDLKKLIDLTLHWIEAEILTESFEDDMPE